MDDCEPLRALRILMVCPQYRPLVGGYERAAERLATALAARGDRVAVFSERRDSAWPVREYTDGVELRRWWCVYRRHWHSATSLLGLLIILLVRGRAFDVWHVHQYGSQAALVVGVAKLLRRPVVLKLTSTGEKGIAQAVSRARFRRVSALLHRRADAVIAPTREMVAEAVAFGIPSARVHLLGNGVDTERFRPSDTAEKLRLKRELLHGTWPVVIYVGRLAEEKNIATLLEAWSVARPHVAAGWKLVIVGDGPLRADLQQLARKLFLNGTVTFVGHQDDVALWLRAADLYALTSRREGLANTLLEAMATGLPVVVTRVSGAIELVAEQRSGRVVANPEELAAALIELCESEDMRRRMGMNARNSVNKRFALEQVSASYRALYAQLLRPLGRRSVADGMFR